MNTHDLFYAKFIPESIKNYYLNNVKRNASPGLDKVNTKYFEYKLDFYQKSISSKIFSGEYKFTPYKEKLIIKNKDKNRQISLPTIKDKIVLGLLKEYLIEQYGAEKYKIIQILIAELINNICNYNSFIKIDIHDFYGSINHNRLEQTLQDKGILLEALELILKAIKNPTVSINRRSGLEKNLCGIPQGIPISNILSYFYLEAFDEEYMQRKDILYFRYVDDILILCQSSQRELIKEQCIKLLKEDYGLSVSKEKCNCGEIKNGFTYLGYKFDGKNISVRPSSIKKFEDSLQKIFERYTHLKKKNIDLFIWLLNLRITGCIHNNIKYGWLFFFSQINDKKLLFHLDWLIKKYIKRYKIDMSGCRIKVKRFVRTYSEITNNLHHTRYIPNFDNWSNEDKLWLLNDICKQQMNEKTGWRMEDIEEHFLGMIYKRVKELERDLQHFS